MFGFLLMKFIVDLLLGLSDFGGYRRTRMFQNQIWGLGPFPPLFIQLHFFITFYCYLIPLLKRLKVVHFILSGDVDQDIPQLGGKLKLLYLLLLYTGTNPQLRWSKHLAWTPLPQMSGFDSILKPSLLDRIEVLGLWFQDLQT